MSLMKNLLKNNLNKNPIEKPSKDFLITLFTDLEREPDFPFDLAVSACEELNKSAKSKNELIEFLLEDVIFTSLYATFYEEILATIMQNPGYATSLVESFSNDNKTREQIISEHTQQHLNYVLNLGKCSGCTSCDNHPDLADLIAPWKNQDLDFFINLYVGMQTIQFTMEYILYDVIPLDQSVCKYLTRENILELRQFVFKFAEIRLAP